MPLVAETFGSFTSMCCSLEVDVLCIQESLSVLAFASHPRDNSLQLLQESKLRTDNVPTVLMDMKDWHAIWYCSEKKGRLDLSSTFQQTR